jgi:predicted transcriptional regulator
MNKEKKQGEKFNDTIAARILRSAGLTPTEIAKILGKKSAQDISVYLYRKNPSKR